MNTTWGVLTKAVFILITIMPKCQIRTEKGSCMYIKWCQKVFAPFLGVLMRKKNPNLPDPV